MLASPAVSDIRSVTVQRQPIEVVVSEDGGTPLSLVMPPYEDIAEIKALQPTHFSIKDWSAKAQAPIWTMLQADRSRLLKKYEKYALSPKYLNRLANLAAIMGDYDEEARYLASALALTDTEFLSERFIENLLVRKEFVAADESLARKDLKTSVYANLRIAGAQAVRGEIQGARERVAAALEIDPLDFGARLFEGALQLWAGDSRGAILSFRIASERRPNSAALHTNLAVAYVREGKKPRALKSLKIAVSIDPLSTNAVSFLADLAYELGRDEDAIPSLRFFVHYEQTNASIWGRLARALLKIKEPTEAIAAIKKQASLADTDEVWNNLGVAYHVKGDDQRALEAFKHALTLSGSERDYGYCLAAKNCAVVLSKRLAPDEVVKLVDDFVSVDNFSVFAHDADLSGIFVLKLYSLMLSARGTEAERLGEHLLTDREAPRRLRVRAATALLALYSMRDAGRTRALELAKEFVGWDLAVDAADGETSLLINNIAFVFADHGLLEEADKQLQAISSEIHKKPYPTATSGLIHFRKSHFERAEALYDEALRLAINPRDKARIRQKWNLEKGTALLQSNPRQALRLLSKAKEETEGEEGMSSTAAKLLRPLNLDG